MTNVIVNAIDVLGQEIDEGVVRISAADAQYNGGSLMLPEYHEQELVAGSTTITGVTSGKVVVTLHWDINRTATFRVFVPDTTEITLAELALQKYDSDPAVVSKVADAALRAEDAADRVDDIANDFGSLEAVTDLVQSASDSASSASGSASAASSSASAAAASEESAGTSASSAASSASAAATSETNADESENVALDASAAAIVAAINVAQYTGTGFPNGVVSAPVGSIYTDTAATNGAIRWIKASGTGNTGWRVEYGDTGWRNMVGLYVGYLGGSIQVRRVNSTVTWAMQVLTAEDQTSSWNQHDNMVRPGFLPNSHLYFTPAYINSESATGAVRIGSNGTLYTYGSKPQRRFDLVIQYPTGDAWPTTLPGTPA